MQTIKREKFPFRWLCAGVALALLLAALPGMARGEAPITNTTTATVSFIDGDLELGGSMQGSGLNFAFGEHAIPATQAKYPAKNESGGLPVNHILPVEDSRVASGDWQVTVALTAFTDALATAPSSFDGVIRLMNPVIANANASAGTTGLTAEDDISVVSGESAVLVMAADDTLPRGEFTATWTNDDVTLNISDGEVLNIELLNYVATLTWTLNIGPQ